MTFPVGMLFESVTQSIVGENLEGHMEFPVGML